MPGTKTSAAGSNKKSLTKRATKRFRHFLQHTVSRKEKKSSAVEPKLEKTDDGLSSHIGSAGPLTTTISISSSCPSATNPPSLDNDSRTEIKDEARRICVENTTSIAGGPDDQDAHREENETGNVVVAAAPENDDSDNDNNHRLDLAGITQELPPVPRVAYDLALDRRGRYPHTNLRMTVGSLSRLGYHWTTALSAALVIHLGILDYRAMVRWNTLLGWIQQFGRNQGPCRGLGFLDGFRALGASERRIQYGWKHIRLWLAHRLQWIITFTMLHDPAARMVTLSVMERFYGANV